MHGCIEATVKTVEIEEEKTRTWLADTYERPLAYRLSAPNQEQMDSLYLSAGGC